MNNETRDATMNIAPLGFGYLNEAKGRGNSTGNKGKT